MKMRLTKGWRFREEGGEFIAIELPHDAMLSGTRSPLSPTGKDGAYFPGGRYEYHLDLELTDEDLSFDLALHFEGVYRNATILVNGQKAYFQAYGFTDFYVNLNGFVKEGNNEIQVLVDNSLVPNARWYTGAGIYRPVYLEKHDKEGPGDIKIRTISFSPAEILIEAKEGSKVIVFGEKTKIYEGSAGKISIPNAHLWTAEDPYLYDIEVTRGQETERVRYGIRTVEAALGKGLLVNGVPTKLKGCCLHSESGILGACSYRDYEFRRIRILKDAGFNAVRMAHNPCSEYLLEACDELGMYVLDEAFDGWYMPKNYHDFARQFVDNYPFVLVAMAKKDFSHPSVIMYSIGNEVTESASKEGIELMTKMRSILLSCDDTRPITCGINVILDVYAAKGIGVYKDKGDYKAEPIETKKPYKEKKRGSTLFNAFMPYLRKLFFVLSRGKTATRLCEQIMPTLDIIGYNYASSRYELDGANHLILGTETMPGDLPFNYQKMAELPNLVGDFVWAGYDYMGEALIGDWTYYSYPGLPKLSGQGLTDINGYPKGILGYCQAAMNGERKPYIAVRPVNHYKERPKKSAWQFTNAIPSWTFPGFEGKKAVIEVYSAAPFITLSLNGRVLGTKRMINNVTRFVTRYAPGTLRAVALNGEGEALGENALCSAQGGIKLLAKASNLELGGDHLSFIDIAFADENGTIDPTVEVPVKVFCQGPIGLLGLGSGLCKTDESFLSDTYSSYQGRLMGIVKSTGVGKGKVRISAEGYNSISLEFICQ